MTGRLPGLLVLAFACTTALADGAYSIKQEDPRTGTFIRRDAATSAMPFNKRYEELSPDELKAFRDMYQNLADTDEPPYPLKGMQVIIRDLIPIQNAAHANGKLFATVLVGADGKGTSVKIYEIPDPKLSTPVAFVLMKAKYKPAKCSGKPCKMEFPLHIDFKAPLQ